MHADIPFRQRVGTQLLVLLGIPFAVSITIFALFLASRSVSDHAYGTALAWSEHAGVLIGIEHEAERFVDSIGRDPAEADAAAARLDAARMRSLRLAHRFSTEEQLEEHALSTALTELIREGTAASRTASPEALAAVRQRYDRGIRQILVDRVGDEQAGSKKFAARGREVSGLMLAIAIAGAAALVLIGAVLARSLRRRLVGSIAYLHGQATRLAGGDLGGTITLPSQDELGQLAAAFNTMAAELRRSMISRSELETLVAQRTRELVEAEDHLRQSQKLDAVGRLAGGIAHDFNNLLAVIMANAEMVADDLPADHGTQGDVAEIIAASERAASLTRQLLTFSRKQATSPRVLSVNDVVTNLTKMFRRVIGEHIALVTELAPDLRAVAADVGQLEQVLTNMVVNARDAMPTGGRLTIATCDRTLDGRAATGLGLTPGTYVVLAITDTGAGMDDVTRARIFEPFFTTKAVGKGTGLGLATAFGIVGQHHGAIAVESELGQGSTFRVYLPVVAHDAVPLTGHGRVTATLASTATILVVEDDERTRSAIARALGKRGYHVLEAATGQDALAVLEAGGEPVHAMLTDLVMPEMHGTALANLVKTTWPEVAVIIMSGYSEHPALESMAGSEDIPFIHKPFEIDALATLIATTLRGHRTGRAARHTDASDRC